jgi:hypothetical protein
VTIRSWTPVVLRRPRVASKTGEVSPTAIDSRLLLSNPRDEPRSSSCRPRRDIALPGVGPGCYEMTIVEHGGRRMGCSPIDHVTVDERTGSLKETPKSSDHA